jgi:hypothetical protein
MKLRADCGLEVFATIQFRLFLFPHVHSKIIELTKYVRLYITSDFV